METNLLKVKETLVQNEGWREPPRLPELFAALDLYDVRYVLFGTVGLLAYGAELATGDLDICPAPAQRNLEHLAALLLHVEARPRYITGAGIQKASERWNARPLQLEAFDHLFQTRLGNLDVVPNPFGPHGSKDRFSYEQLQERAVTKIAFGVHVRVAAFEDIVASKLSGQRAKDLRIVPELERIRHKLAQEGQSGWPVVV